MTSQRKKQSHRLRGTLWRLALAFLFGATILYFAGREPHLPDLDTLEFAKHADLGWFGEIVLAREKGSCLKLEVLPSLIVEGLQWEGLIDFSSRRFVLESDIREAEKNCDQAAPTPLYAVERSGTIVAWLDAGDNLYIAQRQKPRQADVSHAGNLSQIRASLELDSATLSHISFTGYPFVALLFKKENAESKLVLWNYESQDLQDSGVLTYSLGKNALVCDEPGNLLALKRQNIREISVIFAGGNSPTMQPQSVPFAGTFDCTLSNNGRLAYWSTSNDSTVVVTKRIFPRETNPNRTNWSYSTTLNQPIRALAFRTESLLVAIDSEGKLVQLKLRDDTAGDEIKTSSISGRKVPGATGLAVHGARILIWTQTSLVHGTLTKSFSLAGRGGQFLGWFLLIFGIGEALFFIVRVLQRLASS